MPLILFYVKAELEGITHISLKSGANICLNVKNPLSDFEVREKVVIDTSEFLEQDEGSRDPPHHFRIKWEGSMKYSTIAVLSEAETKAALKKLKRKSIVCSGKLEVSGEFVPICALECRGVEPYQFHSLGEEFVVESEGGKVFDEDIDLSEGDWADYDDENDIAVSIVDFEVKFDSP